MTDQQQQPKEPPKPPEPKIGDRRPSAHNPNYWEKATGYDMDGKPVWRSK